MTKLLYLAWVYLFDIAFSRRLLPPAGQPSRSHLPLVKFFSHFVPISRTKKLRHSKLGRGNCRNTNLQSGQKDRSFFARSDARLAIIPITCRHCCYGILIKSGAGRVEKLSAGAGLLAKIGNFCTERYQRSSKGADSLYICQVCIKKTLLHGVALKS